MKNKIKYTFSFTGGSALITETMVIAEEYRKLQDWKAVQKSLIDNNLLNKVKQTTFKREFSEIKKRLSCLTDTQLHLLIHGSFEDTKAMILLSLIKTYPFFRDFIIEVPRNKYLIFERVLTETDYTKFFNAKSIFHQELIEITEITAKKVRQVVFKLLEQVGLITQVKNGTILKPFLNNEALEAILVDDPSLLASFLFSNEEIKGFLQKMQHA